MVACSYHTDASGEPESSGLEDFLKRYSQGLFPSNQPPTIPEGLDSPRDYEVDASFSGLYMDGSSHRCSYQLPLAVRSFFHTRGFFPAPKSPTGILEIERSRIIRRFDLDNPATWTTIERCARLANAFFKAPIVVTIGHIQNHVVLSSIDYGVSVGDVVPYENAICSHTLLRTDGSAHQIPDTQKDWRFQNMPDVPRSYTGQPLLLPVCDKGPSIPVGVLCVLDSKPQALLSPDEKLILSDLADMISREIQSAWYSAQRAREECMRTVVSDLLAQAVVYHSTVSQPSFTGSLNGSFQPNNLAQAAPSTPDVVRVNTVLETAAHQLRVLLNSDFACVLDLSAFHLTWAQSGRGTATSKFGWVARDQRGIVYPGGGDSAKDTSGSGLIRVLGFDTSERCKESRFSRHILESNAAMSTIAAFLHQWTQSSQTTFTYTSEGSALQPVLPSGSYGYLAIPIFTASQPHLLTIVATQTRYQTYEQSEVSFASNITMICLGNILRVKLQEADAAKTAFVSMISHELRTPLHGLLSQLELIREVAPSQYLAETEHLLDTAECCGFALKDVLNDVLDFGKMEMSDKGMPKPESQQREYSKVDLAALATDVMNVSFGRRLQWHSVTGELNSAPESVDVAVSVEEIPSGWWALADAAGLRRVLLNLASNALKYTPKGKITLYLRDSGAVVDGPPELRSIEFVMEDTGLGMSESFKSIIFTPFSQENVFNPGSGLGMSICDGIVRRMGGDISVVSAVGVGTTVTVTLQIQFLEPIPTSYKCETRKFIRKQISEELLPPVRSRSSSQNPSPPRSPWLLVPERPPCPLAASSPVFEDSTLNPQHAIITPQPLYPLNGYVNGHEATDESDEIRVLVVDDNHIGRKILTKLLSSRKVKHAEAADGLEALSVFRHFRPHLVWTDVSMPIMDGIQSARHMREIEKELNLPPARIIAITGLSSQNEMKEGLLGGAALDEWLVKGKTNLKTLSAGLENMQKARRKNPPASRSPVR